MTRYVIMARENYPGAPIKEICRCNAWPYDIKDALSNFMVLGPLGTPIPKYSHVQILKASAQHDKPLENGRKGLLDSKLADDLSAGI